jgi:C4-dicarboxylate-specific signal transduction histidine kinase
MRPKSRSQAIVATSILPFAVAGLAIVIFVVDTVTDLEIAVAVFYIAIVLMSVSFCERRGVVLVSVGCMALTVLSYFLTPTGEPRAGLINCIISISAIGATTYLALKIESAKTAVHEARAQLAHIARVTTLGELTASIAHEVNQPLAEVVTSGNACLRWLAVEPPNLEKAKRAVERVLRDAGRASDVIGRVRSLAQRAPPQKKWFNLNEAILEILTLTDSELQKNLISLQAQLADDLPLVLGDRVQLQQVILNLIINAIDALGAVIDGRRELAVRSARDGPKDVVVTVRDSGNGLGPGKLDRVFDAFYTTKRNGMGLGLTISRSIIEAHGGRLGAAPNTPRGTIFQFTVPIEGEAA